MVSLGNDHHHPLPRTGQKNAICVLLILLPFLLSDVLPPATPERPVLPVILFVSEISIPCHAGPVQFQALHVKLCCYVLEVVG